MLFAADDVYQPATVAPPAPPREFRGAWIAVVAQSGLAVQTRPAGRAAKGGIDFAARPRGAIHFNAVIFQVRPSADASMPRRLSRGRNVSPARWAGRRNRFTIRSPSPSRKRTSADWNCTRGSIRSARAASARRNRPSRRITFPARIPNWSADYGDQLWLDPGEPAAREHVLRVVMDVVRRYDVDGVMFDDYFYPYPEKDAVGRTLDFPDDASWRKYGAASGMSRDDWRRQNVNQFVQSVYHSIKAAETVGEIRHQPVRHLASGLPAADSRAWTPTRKFTPIRACGWPTAGWIIFRRNFTGRLTRRSKVFPCCSTGGRSKTSKAAISGRA